MILPGLKIQLTHFSIFHKKYVEGDEDAEVEDINVVLHGHLQGSAETERERKRVREREQV